MEDGLAFGKVIGKKESTRSGARREFREPGMARSENNATLVRIDFSRAAIM